MDYRSKAKYDVIASELGEAFKESIQRENEKYKNHSISVENDIIMALRHHGYDFETEKELKDFAKNELRVLRDYQSKKNTLFVSEGATIYEWYDFAEENKKLSKIESLHAELEALSPIERWSRKGYQILREIESASPKNTVSPERDYWKKRCLLAEKCLEENPCDPDITEGQIKAHRDYDDFMNGNG